MTHRSGCGSASGCPEVDSAAMASVTLRASIPSACRFTFSVCKVHSRTANQQLALAPLPWCRWRPSGCSPPSWWPSSVLCSVTYPTEKALVSQLQAVGPSYRLLLRRSVLPRASCFLRPEAAPAAGAD